jgi:uncharacterized protein involved in exopolysaccharide biosynthesis/Mrp family chromosome partitioning ATPase
MAAQTPWEIQRSAPDMIEALGLRHALRFLFRNAWLILLGLAVGVGGGLFVQKITPTAYQSKGKFVVDELPFSKQGNDTTDAETERQLVQTLILSVASRDMQAAVAEHLGVAKDRIAFDEIDPPLKLDTKAPQANIEVTSTKESRIGVITATSQSSDFAADVVNAILAQFQLYNQIGGRLKQLRLDLNLARSKADSLLAQLLEVSAKRIALGQQTAEFEAYTKRGLPLESFTAFSTDPTLNNLKTQLILVRSEYDSVAATMTTGARLAGKRSEVAGLQKQIVQHAKALAGAMQSELDIVTTREQDLQAELTKTQSQIQRLNDLSARLIQSYGDPVAMRKIVHDSPDQADSGGNVVVVIDRASPTKKPVRPKLILNLALGILLGGALGFGAGAVRTVLDNRLHSADLVEQRTGQPCLAMLPPLRRSTSRPRHIFDRPTSPLGLSFLRSHFLSTAMPDAGRRIIGFTPSRVEGDSSRLVADLAILLTQADRRTLVIDLHRNPSRIASMLAVAKNDGLSEWLMSGEPLRTCVGYTTVKELAVLGFGKNLRDLDDLLARRPPASELPDLLEDWDFVLVVSPSIRLDWTLMLTLPPGSPLVITANYHRATAQDVVQTVQRARNSHWPVEGVVLENCPRHAAGIRSI